METEVLHIGLREQGGSRVLRLSGELDAFTSERLRAISDTWVSGAQRVVVNLDDLLYIDSAGLSALVSMWIEARDHGAELVLSCNNTRIHRVLEITGLLKIFNLEPSIRNRTPAAPVKTAAVPGIGLSALTQGSSGIPGLHGSSS